MMLPMLAEAFPKKSIENLNFPRIQEVVSKNQLLLLFVVTLNYILIRGLVPLTYQNLFVWSCLCWTEGLAMMAVAFEDVLDEVFQRFQRLHVSEQF